MSMHAPIGQQFFSVMSHRFYDLSLYRLISTYIWGCSTQRLLDGYADNISSNHLEVGVGTGFLLEATLSKECLDSLVLMDLNKPCLLKAGKRLASFTPELIHHDITRPLPVTHKFKSIGMNYVLHCIPGSFTENKSIFKHLSDSLEDGGVLFGATLLNRKHQSSWPARGFMRLLNAVRIFNNKPHRLDDLRSALKASFAEVDIQTVGSAVVFQARKRNER